MLNATSLQQYFKTKDLKKKDPTLLQAGLALTNQCFFSYQLFKILQDPLYRHGELL